MSRNIEKIKFAVVGYGHIGKRHAAIIGQHEECELVAICDILPKKVLGIESSNIPFFNDLDELLQSNIAIDVVCVCTPNGFHASQCLQILNANKHVVCEKPMALTKTSCEQIIHQALNRAKQVFCVMQNRYSPPSAWLKSLMAEERLGAIFMVEINCYWNRDNRYYLPGGKRHAWHGDKTLDGGTLFTQFSHFIDMMYWLFGDIKDISARFTNFNHHNSIDFEDSGIVHFNFINGGMGCLTYSTSVWDTNLESSISIIGSEGSVKVGGQYMNEVLHCHIKNYEMPELTPSEPPNDYGEYKGSAANHHFVIQNVVDVLKKKSNATTNAMEGLKVVDIIERIYNSQH